MSVQIYIGPILVDDPYKVTKRLCFMEAQLGNNPSYMWRSLMESKSIIDRGLRWIIGNDRNVNVWWDR